MLGWWIHVYYIYNTWVHDTCIQVSCEEYNQGRFGIGSKTQETLETKQSYWSRETHWIQRVYSKVWAPYMETWHGANAVPFSCQSWTIWTLKNTPPSLRKQTLCGGPILRPKVKVYEVVFWIPSFLGPKPWCIPPLQAMKWMVEWHDNSCFQ